jgi:hypothetical protein
MCNEVCVGIGQFMAHIFLPIGVMCLVATIAIFVWVMIKAIMNPGVLIFCAGLFAFGGFLYLLGVPLSLPPPSH